MMDAPANEARRTRRSPEPGSGAAPSSVTLTQPDRVLFPSVGLTKQDLADHFAAVAPRMLPHVAHHPLSLVRCPQGRARTCFFQKHHGKGLPSALRPLDLGEAEPYLVVDDAEGLRACAQIGALELHVWGSPADRVDHPDRLVIDLDPGEGVTFGAVKKAAREVRDRLAEVGLPAFALLTGGKGIHVVVPLDGSAATTDVKAFAKTLAETLAAAAPDRYLAKAQKAARHGRIYVDYLRNGRGATAIAPYSPRARPGAPVATPVRWDELSRLRSGHAFSTRTLPRRLAALGSDPWADYDTARTALTSEMTARIRRPASSQ